MENTRIADNISEVIDASTKYAQANLKLFKLILLEKLSKVVSMIISTTLVIFAGAMVLLFLSLAAALYLGEWLQSQPLGFLIMGLVFLLPVIVLWVTRKTLVINRMIKSLNDIVFNDDDKDED